MWARALPQGVQSREKEIRAPCPAQAVQVAGGSTPFQWEALRGGCKPWVGLWLNPQVAREPQGFVCTSFSERLHRFHHKVSVSRARCRAAAADVHSWRARQPRGEVRDGCSRGEPHARAGTWAGRVMGTMMGCGVSFPGAEGSRYGSQRKPCVVSPASERESF